ncbi:hypothetical protein BX600DRAFT_221993 [Xylariales sp. PMI_506]|nr:hypothetical protein BX600DRAFT_221993 [Xylariales sp. PMI_506]
MGCVHATGRVGGCGFGYPVLLLLLPLLAAVCLLAFRWWWCVGRAWQCCRSLTDAGLAANFRRAAWRSVIGNGVFCCSVRRDKKGYSPERAW